ncbi:MAG: tol-pal system protein YbgF [Gammaproteobacteria bacterium]|nr:tol-pal system protein YbgF [Gammaproteobacteria bacterium]MCH2344059.1 tol-pal system protein YbgF [Pseudomonadales bacterium]MBE47177.1 tol-pal system protein YbgF [Gammaproteobacteria bacterium]MCS5580683.1 tol-pal system protein YbgF [Gammaproteobacteria bacterium]HAC88613.1 tol-pal system protein YbgF [Gammaproteobacteria bacterium]|tara:strand:+ start:4436 stop:5335 length:900 start_codon:yes stop_codon:yes gene_type:complete
MNTTFAVVVTKIPVFIYMSILATAAVAQQVSSVVESQSFIPGQQNLSSSSAANVNNNDGLSLLLEQNQQLRTEVQALRALVEEQGFEIRKIQRDSLSRYTNVDERLGMLENEAVTTVTSPGTRVTDRLPPLTPPSSTRQDTSTASSANAASENSRTATATETNARFSRGTLQPAILSEQQLYQMAYDSAINSNFERAVAEFDQYLSIYPDGRFVSNAHYWKGQAYLYLNQFGEARDSYEIILAQYEESPKLPDAMYGLGLAYQGLGNIAQARQLLSEIKRRFPNTGVANLADTRLLSLD